MEQYQADLKALKILREAEDACYREHGTAPHTMILHRAANFVEKQASAFLRD